MAASQCELTLDDAALDGFCLVTRTFRAPAAACPPPLFFSTHFRSRFQLWLFRFHSVRLISSCSRAWSSLCCFVPRPTQKRSHGEASAVRSMAGCTSVLGGGQWAQQAFCSTYIHTCGRCCCLSAGMLDYYSVHVLLYNFSGNERVVSEMFSANCCISGKNGFHLTVPVTPYLTNSAEGQFVIQCISRGCTLPSSIISRCC